MSVLLIAPQDQQAWLVGPGHDAALDGVPLCVAHADRVTVPFGWQLHDDRPAAKPRRRRKSTTRKPKAATAPDPSDDNASGSVADVPARGRGSHRGSTPVEAAKPASASGDDAPSGDASGDAAATEEQPFAPAVVQPVVDAAPEAFGGSDSSLAVPPPARAEPEGSSAPSDSEVHAPPAAPVASEPAAGDRDHAPADVPVHADEVAAAVAGSGARLSVVPGEDDPTKSFTVEADGQTSLWAESHRDDHDPSDETPLLKRAFRVVRED